MDSKMSARAEKEILKNDLYEIYIGNLNTVDSNICLPQKGRLGSNFTWKSGNSRFITDAGTVTRPKFGMGNRNVVLCVTAAYKTLSDKREFEATVLEEKRKVEIVKVIPVRINAAICEEVQLPTVVIVRDSDGVYGTASVTWEDLPPVGHKCSAELSGVVAGTDIKASAKINFEQSPESCAKMVRKIYENVKSSGTVSLKPGTLFFEAQQKMAAFLLNVDDDRILYNFREIAGLDTKGAPPMTGWDAPDCKLKGHTTGHYMSALALAYKITGKSEFKKKIDYIIDGLEKCQKALGQLGCHYGYLGAYSEKQFDLLEQYVKYPAIWAPFYTLDKIMSGLYDCYLLSENKKAIEIESKMGDWVFNRLKRLTKPQRDRMWSMYIAGEFGGMMATMVNLYRATEKPEYIKAAAFFLNEKLFYPISLNFDTLNNMHANQHIPQIIGALELYKEGKGEKYYAIAANFWNMAAKNHAYVIGGVGESEMFHEPKKISGCLSDNTAESCASYNLLRLTAKLFELKPTAGLMDYFERVLFNHTLSSFSHSCDGGTTYFMPTSPAGRKSFDTDENTCCHGTGLESRFRYIRQIYSLGREEVYVNLYIPSTLKSGGVYLSQEQNPESPGKTVLTVNCSGTFSLCLRIPSWAGNDFHVTVCGNVFVSPVGQDGYLHIKREWQASSMVELFTPFTFHLCPTPDNAKIAGITYGPYVLAAISNIPEMIFCPPDDTAVKKLLKPTQNPLHFTMNGILLIPLCEIDGQAYSIYFHIK